MFATMTGHWLQARNHKPEAEEVKKQRNSSPGELYDLPRGGFSEEDREEEKQGDFKNQRQIGQEVWKQVSG